MRRLLSPSAAVWAAVLLGGCGASAPSAGVESRTPDAGTVIKGSVERVVDGDTIRVRTVDGQPERVRLLGIDAPEVSDTRTGSAQCGGSQARAAVAARLPRGAAVLLTTDPGQDRRDRFGRLLAYAARPGEGATVQEQVLSEGWARVYVYDRARPFARVDEFRAAAARARRARTGVWEACGGDFRRPLAP